MLILTRRLIESLKKRKITRYNRDTHRFMLAMDLHRCNTCHGCETRSEICREMNETPILHETWCKLYPSLVNVELEAKLEADGRWRDSKWDPRKRFIGVDEYTEARERTKKAVKESRAKGKAFWAAFGKGN